MRFLPPVLQRWMVILLPPLSILVCCMVIMPRHNKLNEVNKNIKTAQAGQAMYVAQLKDIIELPPDPTIATIPMSKPEQTAFLLLLSLVGNHTRKEMVPVAAPGHLPAAPS